MKKTTMTLLQLFVAGCCFGQDIDQAALNIMQQSFDKLASMKTIHYRLNFVDTMIRGKNHMRVKQEVIEGTIEKNAYWHLLFENKDQWLIQGEKLYKRQASRPDSIDYTTGWTEHDILKFGIHSILGKPRPKMEEYIATLKFVPGKPSDTCYVIDIIDRKRDYKTEEIIDITHRSRYWIGKKSLLPLRRNAYGKSLQNDEEAIDIYDFSLSILPQNQVANVVPNFFGGVTSVEEQTDRPIPLQAGIIAPNFSITSFKLSETLKLSELKGKVILLDFWYLSCMPCRILMPDIEKLHKKFANENVVVLGINIKDNDTKEVSSFLKQKGITYRQYQATGDLLADYKLYTYPTTMIIGKDGKIKLVEIGMDEDTPRKLEQSIYNELKATTTSIPSKS